MATDLKRQILDEATKIYLEEGIDQLSMRKVALAVGITPAAIYWHFPNKEALVSELILEGVRLFMEYLSGALRGKDALDRLRLSAEAYLQFGLKHPTHFEMFYLKRHPAIGPEQWKELQAQIATTYQILMDRVRECMDRGVMERHSVNTASLMLLTSGLGLMTLYMMGHIDLDEKEFSDLFRSNYEFMIAAIGSVGAGGGKAQTKGRGSARTRQKRREP